MFEDKQETFNQYAFSAITGYETPDCPFSSASVDDWEEMTDKELATQAEAQIQFAPDNTTGVFDAEKVVTALRKYVVSESQDESFNIYHALGE